MTTATKSVKGPAHKANKILLWSSLVALLCTGLAFLLDHPMRVPPAALGALATPVAFVSLCVVVWRMRHHKSSAQWVDESYGGATELLVSQYAAVLAAILFGFLVAAFALIFNLLHALNVK